VWFPTAPLGRSAVSGGAGSRKRVNTVTSLSPAPWYAQPLARRIVRQECLLLGQLSPLAGVRGLQVCPKAGREGETSDDQNPDWPLAALTHVGGQQGAPGVIPGTWHPCEHFAVTPGTPKSVLPPRSPVYDTPPGMWSAIIGSPYDMRICLQPASTAQVA
jgi:hypothetical protein